MQRSESVYLQVPSDASAISVHWDMDGVLIDSEWLHTEKLTAVARRYDVELRPEYFTQPQVFRIPDGEGSYRQVSMPLHGAGDKNIYYFLISLKPRLRQKLLMTQWLEELLAHYISERGRLQCREGVVDVVNAIARRGAFQAIVTSGIRAQVEANLETLEAAAQHIAFALTADDVTRSKPDPQGYLISKARANAHWSERGIDAADVFHLAIEDSPAGVRAALDAGLHCIQYLLPNQHPVYTQPRSRYCSVRTSPELAAALGLRRCLPSQSRSRPAHHKEKAPISK